MHGQKSYGSQEFWFPKILEHEYQYDSMNTTSHQIKECKVEFLPTIWGNCLI